MLHLLIHKREFLCIICVHSDLPYKITTLDRAVFKSIWNIEYFRFDKKVNNTIFNGFNGIIVGVSIAYGMFYGHINACACCDPI